MRPAEIKIGNASCIKTFYSEAFEEVIHVPFLVATADHTMVYLFHTAFDKITVRHRFINRLTVDTSYQKAR
jgi:hypothetical protein